MAFSLLSTRVYYPTSKYAPVAVACLRLGASGDTTQEIDYGFINDVLADVLGRDASGGVLRPGGDTPPEVYGGLVLGLQTHAGHEVAYSRVEACRVDGQYRVFVEYIDQATALYAADLALDILNAADESPGGLAPGVIAALRDQWGEFVAYATARRIDPNTRWLRDAAKRLRIPVLGMDMPWDLPTWPGTTPPTGIVQYGWGVNQRRCLGSFPLGSLTSEQFRQVADCATTVPRLRDAQIPLAGQDLEFTSRNKVRRAQRSAARIGYPVTVRPKVAPLRRYGLLDNGVFGPLLNDEQLALAVAFLTGEAGADVWVESYVEGAHYRFLLLGGEVVSVLLVAPPGVIGDGARTLAALARERAEAVEDVDTRRAWRQLEQGDGAMLCRLRVRGLDLSSIPAPGEAVALRDTGTAYNGGSCTEFIDQVPAHFHEVAQRAAATLGLQQMAAVDMVIQDLQGPAEAPNCVVTDVDPVPDLVAHGTATEAGSQRLMNAYFCMVLPRGSSFAIPSVAITGTNGKTTTSRMTAAILKETGVTVGLSCSDGSYVGDELLVQGDEGGVYGANNVLSHIATEAAVLETARGNMANSGIAFERVDVGVCLNIAEDHLGYHGIETLDQMAAHKRQVIERASRGAVLNAGDPRCVAMRDHADVENLVLFTRDADHPEVVSHTENGGCAAVVENVNDHLTVVLKGPGPMTRSVIAVADIPATRNGAVVHNIDNALAAVGTAHCLGIAVGDMAAGLAKFVMGVETTPGRLNEISGFPFEVLIDAAHNPHGMRSLAAYLDQRVVSGRKIYVVGVRKFFSHDTIQRCAAELAGHFDLYILRNYRPMDPFGPEENKAIRSLETGLLAHGVPRARVIVEQDVLAAVDLGIDIARKGDLLLVQVTAGGNHKWQVIERVENSARRAVEDRR